MIFLPFLIIISLSAFIAYAANRKIEETIVVSVFFVGLILYLFAILGLLKYGVYFISALAACGIIYVLINAKSVKKMLFTNIFTPAFAAFFVMFLISLLANTGRRFSQWDEYMHWGPHIKLLFIFDELYTRSGVLIEHKSYLPMMQLFAYWFNKISGAYSEGTSLIALNVIMYAVLLPLLSNIKWKNFYKIFVFILIIYLVPLAVFQTHNSYNSLLMDIHIGLIVGYILYIYFSETSCVTKHIIMCLSIAFLTLTKDSGILFAAVALGVIVVDNIVKKEKDVKTWILETVPFSLSVFLPKLLWELEINNFNVARNRHDPTNISLAKIFDLPNENVNHYTVKTVINFFESLSQRSITDYTIQLSYIGWISLLIIVSIFVVKFFVNEYILKKRFFYSFAVIFLGSVAYSVALLLVWCFAFPENRAIVLGSFDRYLATYLLVILTFLLFIIVNSNRIKNVEYYTLLILLLFAKPTPFFDMTVLANYTKAQTNINMRQYNKLHRISTAVNAAADNVWLLNSEENETLEMYISRYEMLPMNMDGLYQSYEEIMPSLTEWETILYNQYQYVYVLNSSVQFREDYQDIFSGGNIDDDCLYKVIKNEQGNVMLEEVPLNGTNVHFTDEYDLDRYIEKLANTNYMVLLALCGDGNNIVYEHINDKLEAIGAKIFPASEKNWSYIGIFEEKDKIFESLKEQSNIYEALLYNVNFKVISESDEYGNYSGIEIDGADYSTSYEGLNIVVYDKDNKEVIDSVCIYFGYEQVSLVRK